MTPVLALWYAFTGGCGLAVGVEAWRGRHAPAYVAAVVTFFCAYGLHFVPMLIAVPALLGCGAAIGERRATRHHQLLSGVIDDRSLPQGFAEIRRLLRAARPKD